MSISDRKADHIQLCIDGDVGFKGKSTLFEEVDFLHNALPELHLNDIDISSQFAGQHLKAPLFIAAMTGGVDRAEQINRDLAIVAQELGIGFAFGSQRPLLTEGITAGYTVRDVAPNIPLLGNLGLVQAVQASTAAVQRLIEASGISALCIHLNPAMEVVQPEGDEDFRGGLQCLERLVNELEIPVIVKETGCGISAHVAKQVQDVGIQSIDVSGAGGTSWVAVEVHRATSQQKSVGERFWDWGIPTASSVIQCVDAGMEVCATGGMKDGLMVAKALSLGASCGGLARVVLQAYDAGGIDGAKAFLEQTIQEIRICMLLTGSKNIDALRSTPLVLGNNLLKWIPKESKIRARQYGG
jgi:isopentenyl-diphosphate delta-isomerase